MVKTINDDIAQGVEGIGQDNHHPACEVNRQLHGENSGIYDDRGSHVA
jgi:hypothetical protein